MTYILNEAQEAWLKALESGEYEQAKSKLFDGSGWRCLGVAAKVLGRPIVHHGETYTIDGQTACLTEASTRALRLHTEFGETANGERLITFGEESFSALTSANDQGISFAQIAAFIRSNPTAVFKE